MSELAGHPPLYVCLLGPVRVWRHGELVGPQGAKRRGLLALLALAANRPVTVDALIDGLWGDQPPASAVNLVQNYVSAWRRAIGPDPDPAAPRLRTEGPAYLLETTDDGTDLLRFGDLSAAGNRHLTAGRLALAASAFNSALSLWRGPPLANLGSVPFADAEAGRLVQRHVATVELWARACLQDAAGNSADVVTALEPVVHDEPLRETAIALQMWALHRSGRSAHALQLFDRTRRVLADELGTDPGAELAAMHQQVLTDDRRLRPLADSAQRTAAKTLTTRTNSFVGRTREVDDLLGLFEKHRLVTLTGPGGSGKTRLAEHLAQRLGPAVVVECAGITDSELVPTAVLTACGLEASPSRGVGAGAVDLLADTDMLLVLDNLEHLPDAAAFVAMLHAGTSRLKLLVTSRRPLAVTAEQLYPLQPLAVPDAAGDTVAAVSASDAVRLFVDRVRSGDPAFHLSEGNAADIGAIVRRLDGLPLALELAAPWLRVLSASDLRHRLESGELAPTRQHATVPRHRSVRAAIGWSYRLLSADEQHLLARLSVFRGSATLPAVEAVCGPGLDAPVLETLASLVDANLAVAMTRDGSTRIRLLETVRAFADEKLTDSGQRPGLAARHLTWFTEWSRQLEMHREGPDAERWVSATVEDADNLRAAMDGAGHDADLQLQLVVDCMTLWHDVGLTGEGIDRLQRGLTAASPDVECRPAAIAYLAWLTANVHRGHACRLAWEAVELARAAHDPAVEAFALQTVGDVGGSWAEQQTALDAALRLVPLLRQQPVVRASMSSDAIETGVLNEIADQNRFRDIEVSLEAGERLLELTERIGDSSLMHVAASKWAASLLVAGRLDPARQALRRVDGAPVAGAANAHWSVDFESGRLAQYESRSDDAVRLLNRALDGAQRRGTVLDVVLAATTLIDVHVDLDQLQPALSTLARAEAVAGRSDDRVQSMLWVRRARLDRLVHAAPAHSLLERASVVFDPDQLRPERIVWFVESIAQSVGIGSGARADRIVEDLMRASTRTGVLVPPWELRLLERAGVKLIRSDVVPAVPRGERSPAGPGGTLAGSGER